MIIAILFMQSSYYIFNKEMVKTFRMIYWFAADTKQTR